MPPTNTQKHIAIAEVTIFALIHVVQFISRFMQEWRYWHHDKAKRPLRCVLYSWFGLIGLLAQLRIAGFALVLATSTPSKSMLIAETVLQGIGLSPLLFEVSFILLRCGQSGRTGPGNSRYPKPTRFMLHFFRFPIFIAIVLVIVGSCVDIRPCVYAGSAILVTAFLFVCGIVAWFAARLRKDLPSAGNHAVLLVLVVLPFLAVRVVYFLMGQYGSGRFHPVHGDADIMVGMGFVMEVVIAVLLLTARVVIEPVWPVACEVVDSC
ncbi:hypothetical protein MW887_002192 [Aspergillus wentii]|nr:hypothetical protein MW887_002192 [Aspergillus wentii]